MKSTLQKKIKNVLILTTFLSSNNLFAQSYNSTDYANQGDTVYVSKATLNSLNYDTTGVGITWDYSSLVGNSQTREVFANPTQTGFTAVQFSYIFNTNNVNLAQTNGQTIAVGSLTATNPYDYFKKTASDLHQSASAYKIVIGSSSINVKNTYTSPDIIYKFPINMGNIDSCNSSYTTNIPGVYYKNTQIKRVNYVIGTGTVITPYGTFANSLKIESVITQTDSIAINGTGYPASTIVYKELKWMDASKKYPILKVRKDEVNSVFITSSIEYLDNKVYYQPIALFGYYPVCPVVGDTIQFQNLSTNSESYSWNFADPSSGSSNVSDLQNPTHVFDTDGTFNVELITYNGLLSDTVLIPVFINANLDSPTISISSSQNAVCPGEIMEFNSSITNGGVYPTYQWKVNGNNVFGADSSYFSSTSLNDGDTVTCQLISSSVCLPTLIDTSNIIIVSINQPTSGSESITACNSYFWNASGQTYTTSGTYTATLTNSVACDSIATLNLTINQENAPIPIITASGALEFCEGENVTLTSDITNGITWSTGENTPSILVSTTESVFVSYLQNGCLVSSAVTDVTVNPNPTPTITSFSDVCDTSDIIILSQGLPSGGIYTVNGSVSTSFDPSNATIGSNTIIYTFTDQNSCSGSVTTTITVENCSSGAGLVENASSISIFPNPASDIIEIKGFDKNESLKIKIYDSTGREIKLFSSTSKIDLTPYPNGIYQVKISNNSFEKTFKLIINK